MNKAYVGLAVTLIWVVGVNYLELSSIITTDTAVNLLSGALIGLASGLAYNS